jgi:two-component system sensor histidine kinase PilS (NtrC family)
MAAGIAHEIRNPLASIAGSVHVLSQISEMTEEQQTLINVVNRESERLNQIISDFLVYSREKNLQLVPTNVVALLEDTVTLLKNHPRMQEQKFDIVCDLPSEATVEGDADRLKQVFWNLADNAMRAMPNGGTLRIAVRESATETAIIFKDSGVGLPAKQIDKIFEPFQSGFGNGTGLGLAIVYQIAQAHGGSISAHSEAGDGAEFTLRLKRTLSQSSQAAFPRAVGAARG